MRKQGIRQTNLKFPSRQPSNAIKTNQQRRYSLIYGFFDALFFIHCTVSIQKELTCEAGPHVYQQWLGEDIVEPWEKVRRCLPRGCKPAVTTYIKSKCSRVNVKRNFTIVNHIKCIKIQYDLLIFSQNYM